MKKHIVRRFITAVLSVMLIILCAVAAVLAVGAMEEEDFNETLVSYQVGLDGKVNLRFIYSDFGSADAIVAEVYAPGDDTPSATYTYKTDADAIASSKTVSVPLAPSEMTYTVKTYPAALDEAGNVTARGKGVSYSVREYALAVIASENEAHIPYRNTMRSLLNFGAMAEKTFDGVQVPSANEGIYKRNTNPMSVLTASFVEGTTSKIESRQDESYGCINTMTIGRDLSTFNFYFTGLPEGTYTATVSKDGGAARSSEVIKATYGSADAYKVIIENVGVAVYNKTYTVSIKDGDGKVVISASSKPLEYLNTLAFATDENAKYNEIAKSMYQFYTLSANVGTEEEPKTYAETLRADCYHGSTKKDLVSNYHWVSSENDDESYYVCSKCFATLGNGPVGDGVELYLPSELLRDSQKLFGSMKHTISEEAGKTYLNYTNMAVGSTGEMDYVLVKDVDSNGISGDGIPGKYLVFKIRLGKQNATQRPGANSMTTRLYINGSSAALSGATQVDFNVANDGAWHTVVYELKGAAGFDTETGLGAVKYIEMRPFSIQWYQNAGDKTYHTAPTTDSKMDIQYMAICDDLAELQSIIDTRTYDLHTLPATGSTTTYTTHYTADMLAEEKAVVYANADKLASLVGEGGDMTRVCTEDADGDYTRFSELRFTGTSGYVGYNLVNDANGVDARYLVFKIRLGSQNASNLSNNPTMTTRFFVNTTDTKLGAAKQLDFTVKYDDQWHTVVYDLSKLGGSSFDAVTGIGNIKRLQLRPFCQQWSEENSDGTYSVAPTDDSTMDLGYVALCDDIADLQAVIDTDTYDLYTEGAKFTTHDTAKIMIEEKAEMYFSSSDLYNNKASSGSMDMELINDGENSYVRYDNMQVAADGRMSYDFQNKSVGVDGRYIVMKIRLGKNNSSAYEPMYARFIVNTKDTGLGTVSTVDLSIPNDDTWYTVVCDLSKFQGDAVFDAESGIGNIKLLQMLPFARQWKTDTDGTTKVTAPTPESRMDIQYFSICDDITDLQYIIDTDTYRLYTSSTGFEVCNTADNTEANP